jgi:Holliday junction DNA helicase RuvB
MSPKGRIGVLASQAITDEVRAEASLRPRGFEEYVGQSTVVE